ncbi:hypothetical protein BRC96_03915 [Halobacteriales archaeon QS_6_64_34]|nr:MAG: hypothetical protein BRC96_03915 [Halobacteriales archaeon QS_6_64_34]
MCVFSYNENGPGSLNICWKITLNGLRLFLPTCPDGDSVTLTHDVVESCCSSRKVVAADCPTLS